MCIEYELQIASSWAHCSIRDTKRRWRRRASMGNDGRGKWRGHRIDCTAPDMAYIAAAAAEAGASSEAGPSRGRHGRERTSEMLGDVQCRKHKTRAARRHARSCLVISLMLVALVMPAATAAPTVKDIFDVQRRATAEGQSVASINRREASKLFSRQEKAPVDVAYKDVGRDRGEDVLAAQPDPTVNLNTSAKQDASGIKSSVSMGKDKLDTLADIMQEHDTKSASLSAAPPLPYQELDSPHPIGGGEASEMPGEMPGDIPTDRNCKLLGPFALFVQAMMGIVVVGSLVLKRQREKPMRPWKVWSLDISKQMLGQLFVHSLNVMLSSLGSLDIVGGNNPCSLYFINIAIDTTVGVLFISYCMRFLTHYFTDVLGLPGFVSGQYTSTPAIIGRRRRDGPRQMHAQNSSAPPSPETIFDQDVMSPTSPSIPNRVPQPHKTPRPRLSFFFKQLALYLVSLLLMKIMVLLLFGIFPVFFRIGRWVLDLFGDDRRGQVIFVMALFPLLMNTIQFWLIDSVLRHNPRTSRYLSDEDAQYVDSSDRNGIALPQNRDVEVGETAHMFDEGGYSGPWSMSWWSQALGLKDNSGPRGQYQGVSSYGQVSYDENSNGGSHSDDEDSQHTYPPVSSTSSSIAALDSNNRRGGERSLSQSDTGSNDVNVHRIPQTTSRQTSPLVGVATVSEQKHDIPKNQAEAEEEDAWDAWGDEDDDPNAEMGESLRTPTQSSASVQSRANAGDVRKKFD